MRMNMIAERERLGMTPTEVGRSIGVHPNALTNWERDRSDPSSTNLLRLAMFYNCNMEYLLGATVERVPIVVQPSIRQKEGDRVTVA